MEKKNCCNKYKWRENEWEQFTLVNKCFANIYIMRFYLCNNKNEKYET